MKKELFLSLSVSALLGNSLSGYHLPSSHINFLSEMSNFPFARIIQTYIGIKCISEGMRWCSPSRISAMYAAIAEEITENDTIKDEIILTEILCAILAIFPGVILAGFGAYNTTKGIWHLSKTANKDSF